MAARETMDRRWAIRLLVPALVVLGLLVAPATASAAIGDLTYRGLL